MRTDRKCLPPSLKVSTRGGGSPKKTWQFVHLWTAATGEPPKLGGNRTVSAGDRLKHLEAVLFMSPQGISSRRASKVAGLADATEVRTLIRQLNQLYDNQGKPYRIEEVAGGYAILTRPEFAPWLRKLSYVPGEMRLGQTALETLSIVAYWQPVTRADIEAIRGVGCSEILKQLMEMDLVRISGRSEDLGRPYLYGTTQRFLQMFGLRSADRLPRIDWVKQFQPSDNTSTEGLAAELEVKESTVKKIITATALVTEEFVDESLPINAPLFESAIDDDDDEFLDDDEDDDDDDDFDDWEEEDDEDEADDELDEEVDEEADEETDEEEEWEEVDDEEEDEELDEEDEDDDWEEDDDDDWDDDDDEEEEDEDWE
jgi:segregation and condensation protein B